MAKCDEIKIKHHFVSREHLRYWSTDRKNIWYTSKYNKIARDGVAGLAMEKYFYSISKTNDEDEEFILEMLVPFFPEYLKETLMLSLKNILTVSKSLNDEKITALNKNKLKNNFIENLYTAIENKIKNIQKQICEKSTIDLKSIENDVLIFTCIQKTKTKIFKSIILEEINKNNNFVDKNKIEKLFEKNWTIISYFFPYIISFQLVNSGYKLNILENNCEEPFITSDLAVFTLNKDLNHTIHIDNEAFYYFPLSPKYALFISKEEFYENSKNELSSKQVIQLNRVVVNSPHHHLFANSREALEAVKSLKK